MKDRFDLENEIMRLHTFAEDIEMVSNLLSESENIDDDLCNKSTNVLNYLSTILSLQADKLMDTMCQCFKLDEYRNIEEQEQVDDMKYKLKKCCKKWEWDTSSMNPIHDMSYDPNS
jgi:DUF438 domain-containing protein